MMVVCLIYSKPNDKKKHTCLCKTRKNVLFGMVSNIGRHQDKNALNMNRNHTSV